MCIEKAVCGKFDLPCAVGLTVASVLMAGRDHRVRSAYQQPVRATVYTASVTTAVRIRVIAQAQVKSHNFVEFFISYHDFEYGLL